jgi:hypothetical protein
MSVADRWLTFAENEARGRSPLYEEIAQGVAQDRELIRFLSEVEEPQQQPNLLLACVRHLGGTGESFADFRTFVLGHQSDVLRCLRTRRTQTNEVGRCAVLLPALAQLPGPLALLEVGASAGLCLYPDRYAYRYGDHVVGDPASPVHLVCEADGPVPLPERLPEIGWRRGIDVNPLDVADDDAMRWLESCVWPDQTHRLERLRAAIELVGQDPPDVIRGDLMDITARVAAAAPADLTLVIFHSAVLAYLAPEDRRRFATIVDGTEATWFTNEGAGVVDVDMRGVPSSSDPGGLSFVIANGSRPLALADPHGSRLRWL